MLEFFEWVKDGIITFLLILIGIPLCCITLIFLIILIGVPMILYILGALLLALVKSIFGGK